MPAIDMRSPRGGKRQSPTKVQDASVTSTSTSTAPRRRRVKKQQQQEEKPKQSESMNVPPPYHVLDVFGDRGGGILLMDGQVPVQSLARMGLVLPVEWLLPIPISEARENDMAHCNSATGKQASSTGQVVPEFTFDRRQQWQSSRTAQHTLAESHSAHLPPHRLQF